MEMQLRKTCNHPYLINGVEEKEAAAVGAATPPIDRLVQCCGKMVLLDKLLPKLKAEGHRVLIFSQMVRMLDILQDYCAARGFGFERLDGQIRGSTRQAAIDRFCAPESDTFVFLLSTRAGGLGINLTVADTVRPARSVCVVSCHSRGLSGYTILPGCLQVIIYDSDWNPQNDSQATARCHRIGQTQQVKVYRLLTHNTYEATMFERATQKLNLEHAVLGDGSAMTPISRQRDANELDRMLRLGAAAVLAEGTTPAVDDRVAHSFMESSIEDLLATRTRVIEVSDGGTGFGVVAPSASGPGAELDVNAEDFWEQVLPGFQSAEKLLLRLTDASGPIQELKQSGNGERKASRREADRAVVDARMQDLRRRRDEFVEDVAGLVEFLCDARGATADGDNMLVMAKPEMEATSKLLTLMGTLSTVFSETQLKLVGEWVSKLEGSRVRTCRAERTVGYRELDDQIGSDFESDSASERGEADDTAATPVTNPKGSKRRSTVKDDEFDGKEGDDVDDDADSEVDDISDYSDDSRTGKKRRSAKTSSKGLTSLHSADGRCAQGGITDVCALCVDGGLLIVCDGQCGRAFHLECVGLTAAPTSDTWKCPDCVNHSFLCLICGVEGHEVLSKHDREDWFYGTGPTLVKKCSMGRCGRFYHKKCACVLSTVVALRPSIECCGVPCPVCRCLEKISMVVWSGETFRCPQHYCCGCSLSGDGAAMLQCIRCPVAFHVSCVPQQQIPLSVRLNKKMIVCAAHHASGAVSVEVWHTAPCLHSMLSWGRSGE